LAIRPGLTPYTDIRIARAVFLVGNYDGGISAQVTVLDWFLVGSVYFSGFISGFLVSRLIKKRHHRSQRATGS